MSRSENLICGRLGRHGTVPWKPRFSSVVGLAPRRLMDVQHSGSIERSTGRLDTIHG